MTRAMEDRIRQIVSQVFGVPVDSVGEDSSPDTIPNWDSMSHIHLILALESEFSVDLSPEDSMEMLSVRLIQMILADSGVGVSG